MNTTLYREKRAFFLAKVRAAEYAIRNFDRLTEAYTETIHKAQESLNDLQRQKDQAPSVIEAAWKEIHALDEAQDKPNPAPLKPTLTPEERIARKIQRRRDELAKLEREYQEAKENAQSQDSSSA